MLDNDYTKAVFYYTKALEEDPSNTKALLQRGKAYLFLDLYHKAIDDYQQAVKLDPRLIKSIKEMSKE